MAILFEIQENRWFVNKHKWDEECGGIKLQKN